MSELSERRKAKRLEQATAEIAEFLHDCYQAAIDGTHTWDGEPPTGIIMVTLGPSGTDVAWAGYVTNNDLKLAERAIGDILHPERPGLRRQAEEENERRIEEYRRTHPFECRHPGCDTRCRTQAGLKTHERACHYDTQTSEED